MYKAKIFSYSKLYAYKTAVSALLIAIAVLLPQFVHLIAGRALGSVLLPMHLPVLLAGFIFGRSKKAAGLFFVLSVATAAPLLSFLATGMPLPPTLWLMLIELPSYGIMCALLYGKTKKVYLSLAAALIAGRLAYALALLVGGKVLGLDLPGASAVWTAFITGLPGIAIQLVLVPVIIKALERAGLSID